MSIEKIWGKFLPLFAAAIIFLSLPCAALAAGVVLDVGADAPVLELQRTQRVVVRALVRPSDVRPGVSRRVPLAVALVLDKSGSMASDRKMENAKQGALEALKMLGGDDIATVVVYDSATSVLVPPVNAGNYDRFREAISSVRAGGSTALYDGVKLGAEKLKPFVREGFVPRIVMLSDGMANVGPSSPRELSALGRRLSGQEMTITTIGLGLDYNEDLMTALAAESGGNAYFARDARSLPEIFARDMEDAVTLTARHVKATLVCGDGVVPIRAIGREGEKRGNVVEVNIDNLYASEKYALFEIEIPEVTDESEIEAAVVKLEYVDPTSGKKIASESPLRISFSRDAKKIEAGRNVEIVSQVEIARNAEVRDEAVRLADQGRHKEASALFKQRASSIVSAYPSGAPLPAAVAADAAQLEEFAEKIEASGSMSNEERKAIVNQSYIQKNQQSMTSEDKKANKD